MARKITTRELIFHHVFSFLMCEMETCQMKMSLVYARGCLKGSILFEYTESRSIGKHRGWDITAHKMTLINNNSC